MKNNVSTQDQFSTSSMDGMIPDADKQAKASRAPGNSDFGAEAIASAEDIYHTARASLSVARDRLVKAESEFEGIVKRNPLVAISAAAGLGWAVGRYLARSQSAQSRRPA